MGTNGHGTQRAGQKWRTKNPHQAVYPSSMQGGRAQRAERPLRYSGDCHRTTHQCEATPSGEEADVPAAQ